MSNIVIILNKRGLPSSSDVISSCQAFLGSFVLKLCTLLLKLSMARRARLEPDVADGASCCGCEFEDWFWIQNNYSIFQVIPLESRSRRLVSSQTLKCI